jgi:hypothetical protein
MPRRRYDCVSMTRIDRLPLPTPREPGGLLSLVGAMADWLEFEADMAEIVASRHLDPTREPPEFD